MEEDMTNSAPAGVSRWYQAADPDIVVELRYTTAGNVNFILWRESTGFAGWFAAPYLDRHAPFDRIDRPEWAEHTEQARIVEAPYPSRDLWLAEDEHKAHLRRLHSVEAEIANLMAEQGQLREAVRQSRVHITQVQAAQ